ncbi:hypothetical protein ACF8EA_19060, partial [Pseudomonas sp. YQ_5]
VSTTHEILGVVFAILITAIFVSMSITLYLPHRLTEHIESMRPNCKLISENRKTILNLALPGKLFDSEQYL